MSDPSTPQAHQSINWRDVIDPLSAGGSNAHSILGEMSSTGELLTIFHPPQHSLSLQSSQSVSHEASRPDSSLDPAGGGVTSLTHIEWVHTLISLTHTQYQTALEAWLVECWSTSSASVIVPLSHPRTSYNGCAS